MPAYKNNRDDQYGLLMGLNLILVFAVILLLISTNTSEPLFNPTTSSPEAEVVAQIDPIDTAEPTALPTDTPESTVTLTQTPTSTNTPEPTAAPTNTPEPADVPDEPDEQDESTSVHTYDPEMIAQGEQLYMTCGGCHGPNAEGIPGLGMSMVGSDFIRSQTDDELLQFIITGRPIWDEDNTTGIDMPSRGGNPMLTNDDILAIIAYMRSLDDGS